MDVEVEVEALHEKELVVKDHVGEVVTALGRGYVLDELHNRDVELFDFTFQDIENFKY